MLAHDEDQHDELGSVFCTQEPTFQVVRMAIIEDEVILIEFHMLTIGGFVLFCSLNKEEE